MFETAQSEKLLDYKDIFQKRGGAYHQAMRDCPDARREEFDAMIERAAARPDQVLVDMPSGGGYLPYYMKGELPHIHFIETSEAFFKHCPTGPRIESHHAELTALPLADSSVDAVISLAGSHHLSDRPAVWREAMRVLRPGGRFVLADVRLGSPQDDFLNRFVHENNSMGHEGEFLCGTQRAELREAGFEILADDEVRMRWHFADGAEMARYVKLLFGMDKADEETVADGIRLILGADADSSGVHMNWALDYITCGKP
jgi:SAM-dependent methyltransferase